jgi:hypothetical protein
MTSQEGLKVSAAVATTGSLDDEASISLITAAPLEGLRVQTAWHEGATDCPPAFHGNRKGKAASGKKAANAMHSLPE